MSSSTLARRDVVWLILAAACWGVGTVISKRALDEFPPFTLLAVQLAASLGFLTVIAWRDPERTGPIPSLLGRLGILNPGFAYALSLLGLQTITASLSVVLWALEPLLIVVLAALVLGERIDRRLALATAAAVAGMVVVAGDPSGASSVPGIALTVAGVVCCAVYSVISRRWLAGVESTTRVVGVQQAWALVVGLVLLGTTWALGGRVVPTGLTIVGVASAVASGVLYYGGAYWFFLRALRSVPASRAVVSFYLIPIVGLAAGFALLGERLGPTQWIGVAVILVASFAIVVTAAERREGIVIA